ncbi:DNA damage-binding protein 1 isoform A [Glycine soja]|uniref:DNA damage-binding protein 1 isoform A n=2 Tax=Glycine soja TaxID=3848 RepID=A0A445I259_GLYSO|nr:DNA damage-binding protein 1 isoform A [Glycine soja]
MVTSSSVRLVSSTTRELWNEWHAPSGYSINVATVNTTQISYLLCALDDCHLLNFMWNTSTGELSDRKKISLGTQPITLRAFSSKNTTHVFAASDRPTVIYSSKKKLLYSNVNLKEVTHVSFQFRCFSRHLPIAKEGELTIGTIDDIQKLHIRSILLGEHARRICHQEPSRTFAICILKYNPASGEDFEMHFVRLLDDQTFKFIPTYSLDTWEYGDGIYDGGCSGGCIAIWCAWKDKASKTSVDEGVQNVWEILQPNGRRDNK